MEWIRPIMLAETISSAAMQQFSCCNARKLLRLRGRDATKLFAERFRTRQVAFSAPDPPNGKSTYEYSGRPVPAQGRHRTLVREHRPADPLDLFPRSQHAQARRRAGAIQARSARPRAVRIPAPHPRERQQDPRRLPRHQRGAGQGRRHHAGRAMAARQSLSDRRDGVPGKARPAAPLLSGSCRSPRSAAAQPMPRALAIAWAYVAHADSSVSASMFEAIVEGYQSVEPLKIGELWALPSLLRFVLIENLRRLALRVNRTREMRNVANLLADRIIAAGDGEGQAALLARYGAYARDTTFTTQLLYRLRDGSRNAGRALVWLENELEQPRHQRRGDDRRRAPDAVVGQRHHRQHRARSQADQRRRLDGVVREGQPGRRAAARERAVCRSRFPFARPLSRRDRRAGARFRDHRARGRRAGDSPCQGGGRRRSRTRPTSASSWSADIAARWKRRSATRRRSHVRFKRAYRKAGWAGIAGPAVAIAAILLSMIAAALGNIGLPDTAIAVMLVLLVLPAMEAGLSMFNKLVLISLTPIAAGRLRIQARRAGSGAHAGRRSLADRLARRCRREPAQSRGALPRQHDRRHPLRAAFRLAGQLRRAVGRRSRGARLCARRDQAAQRAPPAARRRALPSAAPAPPLQRGRRLLDGLGAQARQAARAQPSAARRQRHDVPAVRNRAAGQHRPRDDARRRHAHDARRRDTARRQAVARAQPAAHRSQDRPRRCAATASCSRG